jgi:hypothetical protein
MGDMNPKRGDALKVVMRQRDEAWEKLEGIRAISKQCCPGRSKCNGCRMLLAVVNGRSSFACDCGRDAKGGPYPRRHSATCAYMQPRPNANNAAS